MIRCFKFRLTSTEWSIYIILLVFEPSKGFVQIVFSWVRKDANCVARSLIKFAAAHRFFGYCNNYSLPLVVVKQLRNDDASLVV